ncbi:DUF2977 domain-containing protein [Pediococcus pentosaceus]|uniref:DUF2977 domain-containing protein n=1 Tax=Pediococcus pentosaceus TaxID=1255 RepID=UPI0018FE1053|nr:DUF2977 domain-containing protein [Pediococcus pentosaceus]MBF7112582.1 DUF2977 domain-containing protein [Pediococcus pentosaceus]
MKLELNEKNEIISYLKYGGVDGINFMEFDGVIPDDFEKDFKPYFYLLQNDEIVENPDYVELEPLVIGPSEQDKINAQIMLNQAKQKKEQDAFNAQVLLQIAKIGGNK